MHFSFPTNVDTFSLGTMKKRVDLSLKQKAKLIADRESGMNIEALQATATIKNCFKHANFTHLPTDNEDENLEETFDGIDQTLEKRLAKAFRRWRNRRSTQLFGFFIS